MHCSRLVSKTFASLLANKRRAWQRVETGLVGLLGRVGLVGGLQVDLEGLPVALDRQGQAIVAAQVQVQRTLCMYSCCHLAMYECMSCSTLLHRHDQPHGSADNGAALIFESYE